MKKLSVIGLLLSLTIITACSKNGPVRIITRPIPESLQLPCPVPPYTGTTVGDVDDHMILYHDILVMCNRQIQAIKELNQD